MKNEKRTMNNGKRAAFPFIILVFLFLIITGCPNPFTINEAGIPNGKGSFSLTLTQGRTILPQTPGLSDFAVYHLAFTPASGGSLLSVDRTNATLLTDQIILDPGTYNLTVDAYKDSGKSQLMARGILNGIVITAGQSTAKTVTLEALLTGGMGTFIWNITVPPNVTTATMKIAPAAADGTTEEIVTLSASNKHRKPHPQFRAIQHYCQS